jgi:hypothetical protein
MPMVSTSVVIEQKCLCHQNGKFVGKKKEKEPTNCKSFELKSSKSLPTFIPGRYIKSNIVVTWVTMIFLKSHIFVLEPIYILLKEV